MMAYPSVALSIGQKFREFDAWVFDKLDGRNVRFEWSKKKGWYKQGTRERLFGLDDPEYGSAIKVFDKLYSEDLTRIATNMRWDRFVAFFEYWNAGTIGGRFAANQPMCLTLIDAALDNGLLDPRDFLKVFSSVIHASYLGKHRWTRGFVQMVYEDKLPGITFEGVVGKGSDGFMAKAKTKDWIDTVLHHYGPEEGKKLVES